MNEQADRERFEELKAERAIFGLSEPELAELMQLSNQLPHEDLDDFDRVAATVEQVLSEPIKEPIPARLRQTLRTQAKGFLGEHTESPDSADNPPTTVSLPPQPPTDRAGKRRAWLPWLVSAACLAFALFIWYDGRSPDLTPSQMRSELLASATDIVQVDWSPGPTPIEGASGDVVWSHKRQQGYMRFRKLPINQPSKEQYQLWIFAKSQDEATPIDGGVFDVDSENEVIIPIDAKLRADDVYLFAVTIEKPGGIVVSSRERLPLLAKVD
ncbi:MAG: hypothetical protein GTO62_19465 [Planctomycetales bacterium]|nr:hypothetical protein [Planctomycetales bacterium]